MILASRLAAAAVASAFVSGCIGPLAEKPYGTTIHYATECGPVNCYSAAMLRTVREVREGDFIESAKLWSSVSYRGWIISKIRSDGVEIKPSPGSPESVIVPYGRQDSVENRSPGRYNFESSLLFEEGPDPGTAIMTILER